MPATPLNHKTRGTSFGPQQLNRTICREAGLAMQSEGMLLRGPGGANNYSFHLLLPVCTFLALLPSANTDTVTLQGRPAWSLQAPTPRNASDAPGPRTNAFWHAKSFTQQLHDAAHSCLAPGLAEFPPCGLQTLTAEAETATRIWASAGTHPMWQTAHFHASKRRNSSFPKLAAVQIYHAHEDRRC